jgi:hypothetical protein
MGLDTAGFAMAAIAAGATVGKMSAEKEAAQANLSAINQQSRLNSLQYQQKNLQNLDMIDKILSKQAAQMAVRGVAFSSPSFNAIQRETLNSGARKEGNLKAEESLNEQRLRIERKNVKTTLHAQLFGDTATLALSALNVYENTPKSGKLPQVEDL